MANKSLIFSFFLILSIGNFVLVSGYPDSEINNVILTRYYTEYTNFNSSSAVFENYTEEYLRNGRITFDEYSNVETLLPSLENSSEIFVLQTNDYNLSNEPMSSYSIFDNEKDYYNITMDFEELLSDYTFGLSNVVKTSALEGIITYHFDFRAPGPGGYEGYILLNLYNSTRDYHISMDSSIDITDSFDYDISSNIDILKPIFFGFWMREEHITIYYGNTYDISTIQLIEWDINTPFSNSLNHIETSYQNGMQLISLDFNSEIEMDSIVFDYDSTFYMYRTLYTHPILDESYGMNDYDSFSLLNQTQITNYELTTPYHSVYTNLTNSQDYKLEDNGITLKDSVLQWNENFTDWINSSSVNTYFELVDYDNHDNVIHINDESGSGRYWIRYNFTDSTSGTLEYLIQLENTDICEFYMYDLTDSIVNSIFFRYSGGYVQWYDGSFHGATTYNVNEWIYMKIDYNVSIGYNLSVNNVLTECNFQNNPLNFNRFMFISNTATQNEAWIDSIALNGTIEGYNGYKGINNYPKLVRTLQISNESMAIDNFTFQNLFYTDINPKLNPPWSDDPYWWTGESPDSLFGIIFSRPISVGRGFLTLKFHTKFVSEPSSTNIVLFLDENGLYTLTPIVRDIYSNQIYNYIADYGTLFDYSDNDERLGLFIHRFEDYGFIIYLYNSENLITRWVINHGITYAHDIDIQYQNYYTIGTPYISDGIRIYGIIHEENYSRSMQTLYWNGHEFEFDFGNQNIPFTEYKGFLDTRPYVSSIEKTDSITGSPPSVSGYETVIPYMYSVSSTYFMVNESILYNPNTNQILVDLSSSNSDSFGSLYFEKDDYNTIDIESNQIIKRDYTLYNDYNTVYLTNTTVYNFTIQDNLVIQWLIYYTNDEVSIIDKILHAITDLLVLLLFPIALYQRYEKKGAIVGLILGIIILTFSELLNLTYAIILFPIVLVIGYLVIFRRVEN